MAENENATEQSGSAPAATEEVWAVTLNLLLPLDVGGAAEARAEACAIVREAWPFGGEPRFVAGSAARVRLLKDGAQ